MEDRFTIRDDKELVIVLITLGLPSLYYFPLYVFFWGGIYFLLIITAVIFFLLAPNAQLQVCFNLSAVLNRNFLSRFNDYISGFLCRSVHKFVCLSVTLRFVDLFWSLREDFFPSLPLPRE